MAVKVQRTRLMWLWPGIDVCRTHHDSPEIPLAWAASGWRLWQYAGDESADRPAYGQTSIVQGVSHCDRNLFNGDAAALHRFWSTAA